MTAIYNGLSFKTGLEARWAAFFDLAGWIWNVNPCSVGDWSPDFRVTFPCGHSECSGSHTLLVAVLPLSNIEDFRSHPCLSHMYGIRGDYRELHPLVDAGAAFGTSPKITTWQFSHGAGGGVFDVEFFVDKAETLWEKAATLVTIL